MNEPISAMSSTFSAPAPAPSATCRPGLRLDEETSARSALAFCSDGADMIMHMLLAGFECAADAWAALTHPHDTKGTEPALCERIVTGMARTGRPVRDPDKTRAACLEAIRRWRERVETIPHMPGSRDWDDWVTHHGDWHVVCSHSPWWPGQLNDLPIRSDWAQPLCLWVCGDPETLVRCSFPLGIVGSRAVTDEGRVIAHDVAHRAAEQGHNIISGGAMGTDAAAHWGAIEAKLSGAQGSTIAFFAGGLDHVGPSVNRRLFQAIRSNNGALVSEMCRGTVPEPRRFLLRNRLIAAMSSAVIVTQARLRSGALNTAQWANEMGREVYAVPGSITQPDWTGCNRLIATSKAMLFASLAEASSLCSDIHVASSPPSGSTLPSRRILTAIRRCRRRHEDASMENLLIMVNTVREPGEEPLEASALMSALAQLQEAGVVRYARGTYAIAHANNSSRTTQPRLC